MESSSIEKLSTCTERKDIRTGIFNFQDQIINGELSDSGDEVFIGDSPICPLKHSFSDGIYVREIFIPANAKLTGKIHKHQHPNFLMSGVVKVITETGGEEMLYAPCSMISEPGTKRALYAVTDLIWITVHLNPTNTQDLQKLEKIVIAESYQDFDKYKKIKENPAVRIYNKIIKKLLYF